MCRYIRGDMRFELASWQLLYVSIVMHEHMFILVSVARLFLSEGASVNDLI